MRAIAAYIGFFVWVTALYNYKTLALGLEHMIEGMLTATGIKKIIMLHAGVVLFGALAKSFEDFERHGKITFIGFSAALFTSTFTGMVFGLVSISILGATTGDGGVNLVTLWITSMGAFIGPKSLVSLKAKAMSVLALKSEAEIKAAERELENK